MRWAVVLVLMGGCAGLGGDERAGAGAEAPAGEVGFVAGEPEVALSSDPRFVLRQRLDPSASGPEVESRADGEPFSHRGRRWNVYPLTVYPNHRVTARLSVADPAMADRAALWLFGPMRHDGSWGPPRRFETAAGEAELTVEPAAYGQYALVVGPKTADGFLPRYPSNLARLVDPTGVEVLAQITVEGDGAFLWTEAGERWDVLAPLPAASSDADARPGAAFELDDGAGRRATFTLAAWSSSSWFMPEEGAGWDDAILGNLDGLGDGILALNPTSDPDDEQRYRVLDALGADGAATSTPAILRVVPERDEDGRAIEVRTAEGCTLPPCGTAVYADDGAPVADELVRTFQPTYYDFDETSTYDLDLTWQRRDPPATATGGIVGGGAATPTRYPVFFEHGFNSSAEVWTPVLEALRQQDPRWNEWAGAASVPGYQPVAERAEQLRRNLTAFLAGRAPVAGEAFLRVNVVAHSMGGLDSRYLAGARRYNEDCAALACTSASGEPEACCPNDVAGRPVPWRDRIASITTLSTPHCGSTFADAGVRWLDDSLVDWAFRKVAGKYFGLDVAGQDALRRTFFALSRQYCQQTMGPSFPVPNPGRSYDWACATGQESCSTPALAAADRPIAEAGGRNRLPGPGGTPTIFSWASLSCVTGSCGDVLDPGLLLPHLTVRNQEGDNDGVVATSSARFGIFMGIRSNDHFHWNRMTYSKGAGFLSKLFGHAPEPVDRFHEYWLGELARAGY